MGKALELLKALYCHNGTGQQSQQVLPFRAGSHTPTTPSMPVQTPSSPTWLVRQRHQGRASTTQLPQPRELSEPIATALKTAQAPPLPCLYRVHPADPLHALGGWHSHQSYAADRTLGRFPPYLGGVEEQQLAAEFQEVTFRLEWRCDIGPCGKGSKKRVSE